jgi:integrase
MARKLEAAKAVSFKEAAERYVEAHQTGWKNDKHRAQWAATLKTYAYPVVGALPMAAIDEGHVLKVLEPIWTTKPETASRVRQRMESVIDWETARKYRVGDNPARWRGHLDKLLPKTSKVRRVRNHPALPYAEIQPFMTALRERDGISARTLEFTVLTACRTGEAIGAKWDEFNLADKIWTVPAERMKSGREHRVPLSGAVLEVLRKLPREKNNPHVFIGARSSALSNMAMLELLRGLRPGMTVHGFRSTFRDWAAEKTNYPNHVVEAALAHVIGDRVEAAYRRGDLLDHRKRLMDAWATYCDQKPAKGGTVVSLQAKA